MLVSELLNASLRKIGGLSQGETIEATRQAEALAALQSMLRLWGAIGTTVYYTTWENVPMTDGKTSYTWGTDGDIDTPRPNSLLGACILGEERPLTIMSDREYRSIPDKSAAGVSKNIYIDYTYPLATAYVYPVPATGTYTLMLNSLKPFVETDSFDAVGKTLAFPVYYEEPLICNLALRLAPEYGRTANEDLKYLASMGLEALRAIHTNNKMEAVESILLRTPVGATRVEEQ